MIPTTLVLTTLCVLYLLYNIDLFMFAYVISITVDPFITTPPTSQLADNGDMVNFTCIAIAFPAPSYSWDTPIPDETFNTSTISINVVYRYFGNYTCTASSTGPSAVSDPALLTGKSTRCVRCVRACVHGGVPK